MESLNDFISQLNNDWGIFLQHKASNEEAHFLDLRIRVQQNKFITSTFFKESDHNGFSSMNSCYHKAWLKAVPKKASLYD